MAAALSGRLIENKAVKAVCALMGTFTKRFVECSALAVFFSLKFVRVLRISAR